MATNLSRNRGGRPKLATETVALIQQMAKQNRLWGAERVHGGLLKLGCAVAKRSIQEYIACVRQSEPSTQNWSTFLENHVKDIWACDFLPVSDLFSRPIVLFVIVELASRRIVHFGVSSAPSDEWAARQLREATRFGQAPCFSDSRSRQKVW
ncbi:MAG: hypothetical protein M1482_07260 [Chloroflexi bacterium]|nr:hypothetical protein [Chloroflexota bacterium]